MQNSNKRGLTVFIGRFSPFHKGHAEILKRALNLSQKVLVIIGSANKPRDIKNPWTFEERACMINSWYETIDPTLKENSNLVIVGQRDHLYNHQRWLAEVQQLVKDANAGLDRNIYITGSDRDSTTFYLKQFPNYKQDFVSEERDISRFLSATSIRDVYFGQRINSRPLNDGEIDELNRVFAPSTTADFLSQFRKTDAYQLLLNEYQFQVKQDLVYSNLLHKPTFNTVDAVVIQSGYILLVKRRNIPGLGLWALPGGYINVDEWMIDSVVRKLIEETKIDVPKPVIYGSLKDDRVFDAPDRSIRGRIITRAYLFKLPDWFVNGKMTLPKVKGSDDAEIAKWFSLSEVTKMSDVLFEDHYSIIETMIGRL